MGPELARFPPFDGRGIAAAATAELGRRGALDPAQHQDLSGNVSGGRVRVVSEECQYSRPNADARIAMFIFPLPDHGRIGGHEPRSGDDRQAAPQALVFEMVAQSDWIGRHPKSC